MDTQDRVRALAEPLVEADGLDLVDVELKGTGGSRLLRIRVDRKGGVTLGACQDLSRRLSEALDAEDLIDGRYALEVTSPGVDHPLRGRRAFDRVEGRPVLVHRDGGDGRVVQVRGVVERAEPAAVVLRSDAGDVRIPYGEVVKASQTLPW